MNKQKNMLPGYLKVGRISKRISDEAHIKSAYVYISQNHITHISNKHKKELINIGLSALDFIK